MFLNALLRYDSLYEKNKYQKILVIMSIMVYFEDNKKIKLFERKSVASPFSDNTIFQILKNLKTVTSSTVGRAYARPTSCIAVQQEWL